MRKLSILVALLAVVAAVAILARGYFRATPLAEPPGTVAQRGPADTVGIVVPEHGPVGAEAPDTAAALPPAPEPARADDTATRPPPRPAPDDSVAAERPAPVEREAQPRPGTDPERVLARAAEAYGSVRTLRAAFVQRVENPVLGRTTVSRGTLAQRRPDRFLMDFSEPAGDRIVSDGRHLWVYYPSVDTQQVIRMPAGEGAGGVDLQAQFLGDPTERFEPALRAEESVDGRPADVLVLTPRVPTGYRRLVLWVDRRDGLARRFRIVEDNGTERTFELSEMRTGMDLPDSLFRFTPPPGARVVDRG